MGLRIYVGLLLLTPKSCVCHLTVKTVPSCPGFVCMLHPTTSLIAGSAEHSPPLQLKTSHGGFLRFKERTLFNSVMRSNNCKTNCYNILYLNYGHNVTFNCDYALTWFNNILPSICNCKTELVSNHLKAFKLQIVVQAPMNATTSSNYYSGLLDQRPSI